ncbi:adenylyltransferase/cytidyltransferase family protein [Aquirufa antheringensis]|uniref:D-glycero-beta-D-manno-heptose 1-phosphate adenylyltransferase n=1 Tax=Aquirufa antheringensis TaxID=2516559 RepID=A0A4Q9BG86_9BACT|nr:adenylyltransferase/cytidyltransferase family protein [Aquirufa antheringensis]MCZ2484196.1 adenylyltransferase/cytidyltransferase family protein [Aquirufa antheringensis]MCZ2487937.1 adenylyltransferase/cytidyltransferase family protein [Aquirufa antheringensis]MCZ2489223.1 adenylyltransferase/cytidyltransferase family protein [Aquirufa antheringensis]TBH74593.1 D-glycero-beta-D-manno-heptose 1-phosphate adenylyltransferase [Aquirufa antheringensis]
MNNRTEHKIVTLAQGIELRKQWKANGDKVVFTNGCFDILHLGHVDYLEKSSEFGTKMIVAVNSDASVRTLEKGVERPVNAEYARARLIAAMGFVSMVIIFGDSTPLELIQSLSPDVLVKGDDYTIETIVGAKEVIAAGGSVKTIALVPDYSTTKIIQKLKQ